MLRFLTIFVFIVLLTNSFGNANSQPKDQRVPGTETIQLSPLNTVTFRGTVDDSTVIKAIADLAKLDAIRGLASYPLYIVLDSPGGSIDAGLDFINFAKNIRNVKTVSLAAASMASAIAEQLPGERLIIGTSILMFHRAKAQISGQLENGELESRLALTKAMVLDLETRNANRIGLDIQTYKEKVKDEWWLYGQQNIEQKTADRIVNIVCTRALIDLRENIPGLSFVELSSSRCPLFRTPIE